MHALRARLALLTLLPIALMGASVWACSLHGDAEPVWRAPAASLEIPPSEKLVAGTQWVGPSHSGSWFSADRSGEGVIVQILDDGTALAVWFTYPPEGLPGEQAWIFAQDGVIVGDTVEFSTVFTTRGPRFGAGFNSTPLQIHAWGALSIQFGGCNSAELNYAGPAAWGSGSRSMERLTAIDELRCDAKQRLTNSGARDSAGLTQRSAAWYDVSHVGEGWLLEELPDGRALIYWFTYDEAGEQAWTIGIAEQSGASILVTENLRPVGTHFGADFDPAEVRRELWGSLTVEFDGCLGGQLSYQSTDPRFGGGSLVPTRLTSLAGTVCHTTMPTPPGPGNWRIGAAMPMPQSEVAFAAIAGQVYLAGGFGGSRDLKRYSPANGAWQSLATIPGARNHAIAVGIGDELLISGGYPMSFNSGDQLNPGWRYDTLTDQWQAEPQLPPVVASGGASLNGFAWFAGMDGSLSQFDPRSSTRRVFAAHPGAPRDHSQLLAFQGELWLMGGRDESVGETRKVAIFDPASERWRDGPDLRVARAGFAAAANDQHILIGGGEVIINGRLTLSHVESISAGQNQWQILSTLPQPVHGAAGYLTENEFHVLAGSRLAGSIDNRGDVQVLRWD